MIEAHKSGIQALALNEEGTLLATCSTTGTMIRIYNVETGMKTHEFRRGIGPCVIYSLVFDFDPCTWPVPVIQARRTFIM